MLAGVIVGASFLAPPAGRALVAAPHPDAVQPLVTAVHLPVLFDGLSLNLTLLGKLVVISDSVQYGAILPDSRSYTISVHTLVPLPLVGVQLVTAPLLNWAVPGQMPGGPDALPTWSDWSWTVTDSSGANVSSNWTVGGAKGDYLVCPTTWTDQNYTVTGSVRPSVALPLAAPSAFNVTAPGLGFVLASPQAGQGILPGGATNNTRLLASMRTSLVRFSEVTGNTFPKWYNATGTPTFYWHTVDEAFNVTRSAGAGVLFDMSAGTWGDGNALPKGMPLNTSVLVEKNRAEIGYFPDLKAYASYVSTIVQHIVNANETVAYWSIGNEVPQPNSTVVLAYINVFNVASHVIHSYFPRALVGSDTMMNSTYIGDFANYSHNVGFLSFHFYPAIGTCLTPNGTYCPPSGHGNGTLDQGLWSVGASMEGGHRFLPPRQAQQQWYNLTGRWLPVLDTESNLNGAGGGPLTRSNGSDPRQEMVFGAAWTVATMIDGASQNLTTFTYFSLSGPWPVPSTGTGPYGGWGYGTVAFTPSGMVRYSAYWALHMWGRYIPAGAQGAVLPVADPSEIRAFEVSDGANLSLILVGMTNVRLAVHITPPTGYVAASASVLDQKSYVETFKTRTHTEVLVKSSVRKGFTAGAGGVATVTLNGYAVAAIEFVPSGQGPVVSLPRETVRDHDHPWLRAADRVADLREGPSRDMPVLGTPSIPAGRVAATSAVLPAVGFTAGASSPPASPKRIAAPWLPHFYLGRWIFR